MKASGGNNLGAGNSTEAPLPGVQVRFLKAAWRGSEQFRGPEGTEGTVVPAVGAPHAGSVPWLFPRWR